jgi:hypothetical protein
MARAKRWSSSLHAGMPTRPMFAASASATGRLKCGGHAAPITRTLERRVPVIIAAPVATESAIAHSPRMRGASSWRRKYHTDAVAGTTFGWSPPSRIT